MKMVKLLAETHKKLSIIKAELGLTTFTDVIEYLIGLHDGRKG